MTLIVVKDREGKPVPAYSEHQFNRDANKPIAVVNNPKSWKHAWCLPCAVASNGEIQDEVEEAVREQFADDFERMKLTAAPKPAPKVTVSSEGKAKLLGVEVEPGKWTAYNSTAQATIAAAVAAGKAQFKLDYKVTFNGKTSTNHYTIDLKSMLQTNVSSGTTRNLKWM